jgi:hypothetical protein
MNMCVEQGRNRLLADRIGLYWSLIKSPQTGLLLLTGLVGFLSAGRPRRGQG